MRIHATAIAYDSKGVLIRGDSGSGKSTLAAMLLRSAKLLGKESSLVADDIVILKKSENLIRASAPDEISGLLELRGYGPIGIDVQTSVELHCVIDIVNEDRINRLPEDSDLEVELEGVCLRRQPVPDNSFERMLILAEAAIFDFPRIC